MKYILELMMFFSALLNLIYFNYYLGSFFRKQGFKGIIDENQEDESEAIKQIVYIVLAFLGIIYFDFTTLYSISQNFNLSNILSLGKEAIDLSITILLDTINEILPARVYDFVENAFGFFHISFNQNLISVIGIIFSLLFNFFAIKSILLNKYNRNAHVIPTPESRLFNQDFRLEDSSRCFFSLLLFEATGYFIDDKKINNLIVLKNEITIDNNFSIKLFNQSLKEYLEVNEISVLPISGGQSWDLKYQKQRLKYLEKVYTKLYSDIKKESITDKQHLLMSLYLLQDVLQKSIEYSNKQTQNIKAAEGTGDWMKDSLNRSLQDKLSEYSFRGIIGGEKEPINQISLVLKKILDEFENKLELSKIEHLKENHKAINEQGLLLTIFELILENKPSLEYSKKEISDFKRFSEECVK